MSTKIRSNSKLGSENSDQFDGDLNKFVAATDYIKRSAESMQCFVGNTSEFDDAITIRQSEIVHDVIDTNNRQLIGSPFTICHYNTISKDPTYCLAA